MFQFRKSIFTIVLAFSGLLFAFVSSYSQAQILIDDGSSGSASSKPEVIQTGKSAARDFMRARSEHEQEFDEEHHVERAPSSSDDDRYLMLHIGTFLNDKAYRWGVASSYNNVGSGMIGVTYRVGEWKSSMDLWFRAELLSYNIDGSHPQQLSMMPIIAFPDARSSFPMYFGGGLGPGIFLNQVDKAGDLALNYTVLAGARFPRLFGSGGLFGEVGLKGMINLLSEGQQQGVYIAAGGVFVF